MEILTNLVRDLDKHFGQKSTANFTIRHYSYQFEFPLFRKGKQPQFREVKGYKLN